MKIRTRLSIQFTIIVATILILFSVSIYYVSSSYREQTFYSRIKDKALTTARLLIRVKEIDYKLLDIIEKNTIHALIQDKIVIMNDSGTVIYSRNADVNPIIPDSVLHELKTKKEFRFQIEKREAIGLTYFYNNREYYILASAFDKYGLAKIRNLQWVIGTGLVLCVTFTLFAGWFYAGQALQPISSVIGQVDKITATKLNLRVEEGNKKDEIALLAINFNRMLDRLQNAFEMQKSFVSNASHEIRTPLTSITGQIEVALIKERRNEEYRQVLTSVLEDIIALGKLSNGLLDLAITSSDISVLHLENVRVDELLFQARSELLKRNKDYSINILFVEFPEEETKLIVYGSERLLKTAFLNLMDNACKYSDDKHTQVEFSTGNNQIHIKIIDKGMGISPSDMEHIFQPFFRANNVRHLAGHGLGLSLTEKIINIHKGILRVQSQLGHGTTFAITLTSSSIS